MELVKWIIVLLIGGGVTAAVAVLSSRGDHLKRLFVVAMIWSSLAFPIVTIDFQFGERHNVRGWEFGWPDFIALGLICGHIMRGRPLKQLVGPLSLLWIIHFIILEISALQGIDPLFSHYAIVRQLRTFLVLTAATACIRSWRDGEAVIAGLAIVCLVNEWRVLQQKYLYGRFQCVGSFDHQNAMAMFLTMAGPILVAALMLKAVRRPLMLPLIIALGAAAHGVISSLSRAGMLIWGVASIGSGMGSFLGGITGHKLRLAGVASCLGLIGVALMLPTILLRFNSGKANDASHRTREVMNNAAAMMYADNKLLGVGPNNYAGAVNYPQYAEAIDESIREKGHKVDPDYKRGVVESHYWQMKSETGLLGYITFMLILGVTLLMALWKALANGHVVYRAIALGVAAGFMGNYLQSTIEHTLVNYSNAYLWMTLQGALQAIPWFSRRRTIEQLAATSTETATQDTHSASTAQEAVQSNPTLANGCKRTATGDAVCNRLPRRKQFW